MNLTLAYGRSPKGRRVNDARPTSPGTTVNAAAAMGADGIATEWLFTGTSQGRCSRCATPWKRPSPPSRKATQSGFSTMLKAFVLLYVNIENAVRILFLFSIMLAIRFSVNPSIYPLSEGLYQKISARVFISSIAFSLLSFNSIIRLYQKVV
jgi:hypothetical protein